MISAGTIIAIWGWHWDPWFPINKPLWTSSYVLWTGGLALYLLAACYWLIEIKNWRRWSKPFEVLGVNAIAAYLLHVLFLKIQNLIHVPRLDGTPGNLRFFITEHLFGWASLQNASLFYALSYTLLWLAVLWTLHRRKIYIKI
jgi:predicted acyltransferase